MQDYQQQRRKQENRLRSTMDFIMGILVIIIGVVFLIYEQMGWQIFRGEPTVLDKIAGALFVLYGIWRIYRGFKRRTVNEVD